MGGDCEGVKGATADIRLFPLPPCRVRRRETLCAMKQLHISIALLHLRKQPSDANILRQRAVVIY